jgi:signal transduction histidine kinase
MKVITLIMSFALVFHLAKAEHAKDSIDLSDHDFVTYPMTSLRGEWEFYWKQLLTPSDFTKENNFDYYSLEVPHTWQSAKPEFSNVGYGTYRVVIMLPPDSIRKSIHLPFVCSSAVIWVDGKLVAKTGKVAKNTNEFTGQLKTMVIPLPDDLQSLEIIIQVSNFTYSWGGLVASPLIGETDAILSDISRAKGVSNALIGCLVAMFIYHLILFFLYRRGISYLYLAGICLLVSLRAMVINDGTYLLPEMFPLVDMEYWKKVEFFCVYSAIILFPLYIQSLFKSEMSSGFIVACNVVGAPLLLAVLFFPHNVYGQLLNMCHLALVIEFLYAGYVIFKAWRNKKQEASIIFLGIACAFPPILIEIINNSGVFTRFIHLDFLVETGILTFLLFQCYLLAKVNANAHHRLEILYVDLEHIVAERTRELTDANHLKDKLLSIISHDIKSPLNSLKGLLTIFNMQQRPEPNELKTFTLTLEDELQRVITIANDILTWTSSQINGTVVIRENFNFKAFLMQQTNFLRNIADKKKINLTVHVPDGMNIETDRNIMSLVVRNLVLNAIKFSSEKTDIEISAEKFSSGVVLSVKDSGVGMHKDTVRILFDKKNITSTRGTHNEKGTGLGLILCKQYLELIGGKISVSSEPGAGSTFFVQIPESYA